MWSYFDDERKSRSKHIFLPIRDRIQMYLDHKGIRQGTPYKKDISTVINAECANDAIHT